MLGSLYLDVQGLKLVVGLGETTLGIGERRCFGRIIRMIVLRNRIDNAWSQIDVQLRRRYDLIPNLVETVKGFAKQEETVLRDIANARSSLLNARNPQDIDSTRPSYPHSSTICIPQTSLLSSSLYRAMIAY